MDDDGFPITWDGNLDCYAEPLSEHDDEIPF